MISLKKIVELFAEGIKTVDAMTPIASSNMKSYKSGIGPLTEDQAIEYVLEYMREKSDFSIFDAAGPQEYPSSKQKCDLVIPGEWAIEFTLLKPIDDKGKENKCWTNNILIPSTSNTGPYYDGLRLADSGFAERKAVVVFGYQPALPKNNLEKGVQAFEFVVEKVVSLELGQRWEAKVTDLNHPIHQEAVIYAWEVMGFKSAI